MLKRLNTLLALVAVTGAVLAVGCGSGDDMSKKDTEALKHPQKSPMPDQARDAMKDPTKVKAAGAKYGTPTGD